MRKQRLFLAGLILLLTVTGLFAQEVRVSMQQLRKSVEELWLKVADINQLQSKAAQNAFKAELQNFVELTRTLSDTHGKPSAPSTATADKLDPSMQTMLNMLQQEANRALWAANQGDLIWARNSILNTSGACMNCHTSSHVGMQFSDTKSPWQKKIAGLSTMERADFLAATRYFDAALQAYAKIIKEQDNRGGQDWVSALRKSLVILVRYQGNRKAALDLISPYTDDAAIPFYIRRNLQHWQLSLKEWSDVPVNLRGLEKIYQKALSLRTYPADQGGMIDFLRLSSLAHQFIRSHGKASDVAQAMLYLGYSYQSLMDLDMWPLHDSYFESCIRKLPHSDLALTCYAALESSIMQSSTGSGGVHVPKELTDLLAELYILAK